MSSFIYGAGISNVGSYQVSGRPYCISGPIQPPASPEDAIQSFPTVTKQIVILNRDTTDSLSVYFHVDSPASCQYVIAPGEQQTFDMKCKQIYLSCSADVDATLYASLTGIAAARMYALTGSGITS